MSFNIGRFRGFGSPPAITIWPQSQDVACHATVQFTVAGDSVTQYQWRHENSVIADGATYSGTHTAVLSILDANPELVGTYDCILFNACGVTISPAATLSVSPCR